MAVDAAEKAMKKLQNEGQMAQPIPKDDVPRETSEEEAPRHVSGEVQDSTGEKEASLIVIPGYGTPEKALGEYVSTQGLSLPDGLNFTDYELIGAGVRTFRESGMWIVGDYLNYGEAHFGDMAAQVVDSLGWDEHSLSVAKSVSKSIPMSERNPSLSWAHHQNVASMESDERKRWLDQAEEHGWSRDELRDRIREAKGKEKVKRGRPKRSGKTEKVAKARAEAMSEIQMASFAEKQFAPQLQKTLEVIAEIAKLGGPMLKNIEEGEGITNIEADALLAPIDDLTKKLARLQEQAAQIAAFEPPKPEKEKPAKKAKAPKAEKTAKKAGKPKKASKKAKAGADANDGNEAQSEATA